MDLLIGLVSTLAGCFAIVRLSRRAIKIDHRLPTWIAIELEMYRVGQDLEADVADLYCRHIDQTRGFESSGRLKIALWEAEAEYEDARKNLIAEATREINALQIKSAACGLSSSFSALFDSVASSYPSLGLIDPKFMNR
jgi:hypothetical protein